MKINLTNTEKESIRTIIEDYREISKIIYDYQQEAEEIQKSINTAKRSLDKIKKKEDNLMLELHNKYGDFSIQDIYDTLN